jgi:hypothetical protein
MSSQTLGYLVSRIKFLGTSQPTTPGLSQETAMNGIRSATYDLVVGTEPRRKSGSVCAEITDIYLDQ